MTVNSRKTARQLVEAALLEVRTLGVDEAVAAAGDSGTVLVDVRDVRELRREGRVPGSLHVPRGMLEFWVDPESPYYKPVFGEDRKFVFYCSKGWRSALAAQTAQGMGLEGVSHVGGGFEAWCAAGGPVEPYDK